METDDLEFNVSECILKLGSTEMFSSLVILNITLNYI